MGQTHKKKRGTVCLHRFSEVLDYLCYPITTYMSTPKRESRRLGLDSNSKKCPSFQKTR